MNNTAKKFSLIHDKQRFRSTEEWFTPKEVLEGLGVFDLDPCTNCSRPEDYE